MNACATSHTMLHKNLRLFYVLILALAAGPMLAGAAHIRGDRLIISTASRPQGKQIYLASDLQRWSATRTLMTEARPGAYEINLPIPWAPQIQYKFVENEEWHQDIENPHTTADGHGGLNSIVLLPPPPDPPELHPSGHNANWAINRFFLAGPASGSLEIMVLSPPERPDRTGHTLKTIYVNDGGDFADQTGLRNLVAHRTTQVRPAFYRIVLIHPRNRLHEYFFSGAYADWFHDRLIPAVEARTGVADSPADRVYLGASLGGLAALFHAARWSADFSRIIAQSPSLQLASPEQLNWLLNELARSTTGIQIDISAGIYESAELYDAASLATAALKTHSPPATFTAFPCMHHWTGWNLQLPTYLP